MVQIAGKYKLVENKNFYEFLVGFGVPEELAKEKSKIKGTMEISVDGKKITTKNDDPQHVIELLVDGEVEEKSPEGLVFLSSTKLNGNIVTITSTAKDGVAFTRVWTFSDSGLQSDISAEAGGKALSATHLYKRV